MMSTPGIPTAVPHSHSGREVVGIAATDLRPGDVVLARGCQHRETGPDGCEHRAYAAFDVQVIERGHARVAVHTSVTDQEEGAVPPIVALGIGDRLLVARKLPELDPADAVSVELALPAEEASCGPAGDLASGGDLNRTWTCASARWAYMRRSDRQQVFTEVERIARIEEQGDTYEARGKLAQAARCRRHARNLRGWVLGALVRLDARADRHPRPECTHAPADRRTVSVEESLPVCSC